MKKKVLSLLLAATMVLGMVGCGSKGSDGNTTGSGDSSKADTYELALITDVGTIDDKSFNQGSWEGLVQYAEENNITHKYYKPAEKSDEACLDAIALAVKGGAKVIVVPGFLFEVPIYEAQDKYPDVNFVFIDGTPHDANYENYKTGDNVLSITFAEQQAGYLAGYAAVKDGYRNLGFMGGIAVPAVIRYGYGFVEGCEAAGKELGLKAGDINVKYTYVGNFDASPENQTLASSWYSEGTEVIFACGGSVGNSVMKAAEAADKKVIGVDVDQSSESDTVITSAMKNLQKSVYDALTDYYAGNFKGGQDLVLDASSDGVQLPMETSKFESFSQDDYDALYAKLQDGSIKISTDTDAEEVTGLTTLSIVKVNYVK